MKEQGTLDSKGYSFLVVMIVLLMAVIFGVALRGNSGFWDASHAPTPASTPWMPGEQGSPSP